MNSATSAPARWRYLALLLLVPGRLAMALHADQLALVVNDADPDSVASAEYYRHARALRPEQLIHVSLPPARSALTAEEFAPVRARILAATPSGTQAYALAWTRPYRVDCMSITSALTFGFDAAWCSSGTGCRMTRDNPMFDYNTHAPYDDLGMRPSMMLAGNSVAEVRALIDRGVRADHAHPHGVAELFVTDDAARGSRVPAYLRATRLGVPGLQVQVLKADPAMHHEHVLFAFIGAADVPGIDKLSFIPGAVADHLTSFGGMLTDSPQMSALRWLQAGATGSYGTVHEPCNYRQKFPDPAALMRWYTHGDTLLEAYWKSVSSPGEGVFIGEPLASPWR